MSERPRRILHVVGPMNRGGIETWLMHVMRHLDQERVHMDFLVDSCQPAAYDAELLSLGARILRCPNPHNPLLFGRRFLSIVKRFGPYDVLHSHVHHYSGYALALGRMAGIPVRIAHSHSDTAQVDRSAGWARRCYFHCMKRGIQFFATRLVATSDAAGRALFGDGWVVDPRSLVLCCGINLAPFRRIEGGATVRAAWGIAQDDFVIGHVGRFETVKNHMFLLEVAAEVVRRQPRTRVLLVGDGPLRQMLVERIRDLGIGRQVILTGVREDVADLLSAMDVFVFPSLNEGLGLAMVEAQAAGLPCVVSDVIPSEADVVPALIHRVSLADDCEQWAGCVLSARSRPAPGPADALAAVESSVLNVFRGIDSLYALYGATPAIQVSRDCDYVTQ